MHDSPLKAMRTRMYGDDAARATIHFLERSARNPEVCFIVASMAWGHRRNERSPQ